MSSDQRALSDRITARRGRTRGPFLVWLRSPGLCERVEALGAYVRFETPLPLKLRELGLLIAARFWDAQYSWNAHVEKAVEAGIDRDALLAIAERREPQFAAQDEAIFYSFCTELLQNHFVSDPVFERTLAQFGEQALVDVVGVLGNASMLAMCLNAFEVDLPAGAEPPFGDLTARAH